MLIGVYSAIYLLEQGFSFNDLALFSAVFTATIALSEIPIAVFADTRSRKLSVLLGMASTVLFYLICLFPQNIFYICIAYFLYGMASSFISGAVEGVLLHSLDNNEDYPGYIHLIAKLSSLGSFFAGILSYIIYREYQNYKIMYLLAAILTTVNIFIFFLVKEKNKNQQYEKQEKSFFKTFKESFLLLRSINNFYFYAITSSLITMVMQIFFYFWQPVMSYKYENISSILIYCYIGVFLSQFIINEVIKRLKRYNYFNMQKYLYTLSILFITSLVLMKKDENIIASILFYILSMGALTMIPTILHNKLISSHSEIRDKISTCLSTLSSIARFFSFILLINIYFFFNSENPLYILCIPIAILFILFLVHLVWNNREKEYFIKTQSD